METAPAAPAITFTFKVLSVCTFETVKVGAVPPEPVIEKLSLRAGRKLSVGVDVPELVPELVPESLEDPPPNEEPPLTLVPPEEDPVDSPLR